MPSSEKYFTREQSLIIASSLVEIMNNHDLHVNSSINNQLRGVEDSPETQKMAGIMGVLMGLSIPKDGNIPEALKPIVIINISNKISEKEEPIDYYTDYHAPYELVQMVNEVFEMVGHRGVNDMFLMPCKSSFTADKDGISFNRKKYTYEQLKEKEGRQDVAKAPAVSPVFKPTAETRQASDDVSVLLQELKAKYRK